MTVIAQSGGSLVFMLVLVVLLGGVVYGFFTITGSGIGEHPSDGSGGAPGAKGPSEASGQDQGDGSAFDTHGTR